MPRKTSCNYQVMDTKTLSCFLKVAFARNKSTAGLLA